MRLAGDDLRRMVRLSFVGLGCLAVVFALGYMVGKRAAPAVIATVPPGESTANPIARLDAEKKRHAELQFFDNLSDRKPPARSVVARVPSTTAVPQKIADAPATAKAVVMAKVAPVTEATAPVQTSAAGSASAASKTAVAVQRVKAATTLAKPPGMDAGPALHGDFTVQVSAFKSFAEADAFAAGLQRKGFRPFIVTSHIPGKGTWYRVRIGRFSSPSAAGSAKQTLAQADIAAWVLRTD